jgi:TetR/AcrR family transcriptional regulator, fatty acid metabolism regulator protein
MNYSKARTDAGSKGEQTQAKLRRAAAAVFAERGYHTTKVSDIVQELGLSQPTFYSYFASKEAAYEALVGEFRLRLETLTKSLLIEAGLPDDQVIDRVALSFQKFLDFLAEDPHLTEIGFFQPPGCTATKAGLARWIATNIAKEQRTRLFRSDIPAEQIGKCFVGMLDQLARTPGSAAQRKKVARGCALLLCEGLWLKAGRA